MEIKDIGLKNNFNIIGFKDCKIAEYALKLLESLGYKVGNVNHVSYKARLEYDETFWNDTKIILFEIKDEDCYVEDISFIKSKCDFKDGILGDVYTDRIVLSDFDKLDNIEYYNIDVEEKKF